MKSFIHNNTLKARATRLENLLFEFIRLELFAIFGFCKKKRKENVINS